MNELFAEALSAAAGLALLIAVPTYAWRQETRRTRSRNNHPTNNPNNPKRIKQ